MVALDEASVRSVRPRLTVVRSSFNVVAGLATSAAAVAVYVTALYLGVLPSRPFSVIFFTVAVGAAWAAVPILLTRGAVEQDPALRWAGTGAGAAAIALTLQLLSYPTVTTGGGVLGTDGDSSSLLYLSFHLAVFLGVLLGALQPRTPVWWFGAAMTVLNLLAAVNAIPTPALLTPAQTFTGTELVLQWVLCGFGAVAVALWLRRGGLHPSSLFGWVGVAALLLLYELAMNALAGERYSALWWASLSLRAVSFAALAVGGIVYVLRQGRRMEAYTRDALNDREQELTSRVVVIDELLTASAQLAGSLTPQQVADVLCAAARRMTGAAAAVVTHVDPQTGRLTRLAATGPVPDGDGPLVLSEHAAGAPAAAVYADDDGASAEAAAGASATGAVAVLPLRVPDLLVGVLEVRPDPARRGWTTAQRELLQGLADQGGPALSRSRLALRERQAAETLQRSLLPAKLVSPPGLRLAATYQAATLGHLVGGDWYDAWTLPDGSAVLVIGDVVGKGLTAAATTGRLRASIRALAATDPSPAQVLGRLDAIEGETAPTMVATVAYLLLEPGLRRGRLTRAGHLPPLLAPGGGSPLLLDELVGPPIGVGNGTHRESVFDLPEEFLLLLYTDGLIEDRKVDLDRRLQYLVSTVAARTQNHATAGTDPHDLAPWLMETLDPHGDDVAILAAATTGGVRD